jgi:hypothetical protein
LTGCAAEATPIGEIIGEVGHYRYTAGTTCRLMSEDFDRVVGKKAAATAAWPLPQARPRAPPLGADPPGRPLPPGAG